jgi:hypothetical protein
VGRDGGGDRENGDGGVDGHLRCDNEQGESGGLAVDGPLTTFPDTCGSGERWQKASPGTKSSFQLFLSC